jgi:hypothetical protein
MKTQRKTKETKAETEPKSKTERIRELKNSKRVIENLKNRCTKQH